MQAFLAESSSERALVGRQDKQLRFASPHMPLGRQAQVTQPAFSNAMLDGHGHPASQLCIWVTHLPCSDCSDSLASHMGTVVRCGACV